MSASDDGKDTPNVPGRLSLLLRDTAANLLNGVALLLFLPRGRHLRATPVQVGLWLILSIVVAVACELTWTETPLLFNREAPPILLSGLLLNIVLALLIDLRRSGPLLTPWIVLISWVGEVLFATLQTVSWHLLRDWPRYDGELAYYIWQGWWLAVMSVALARRLDQRGLRRWTSAMALFTLLGLYYWFYPLSYLETDHSASQSATARPPSSPPADEALMYRQNSLLDQQLAALQPQRPGVVDLYFVGVAGDAGEPVFQREVQHVAQLMKTRFDAAGRSVLLINHVATHGTVALASQTSLAAALKRVGQLADPQEDIVFVYLSSHGSREHEFVLDYAPLPLRGLYPADLASMLRQARIGTHAVVVSACYAGGFVPALRAHNALVMSAADADSTSFGCGADTHYTWFGEALFAHALVRTRSLEQGFRDARSLIEGWEKRDKVHASNPQIAVGANFGAHWKRLEQRLETK